LVSFRNNRFRALLLGLIVADAASQGLFSEETLEPRLVVRSASGWGAFPCRGGLASDHWCHQIAADLGPSPAVSPTDREVITRIESAQSPEDLLAVLPTAVLAIESLGGTGSRLPLKGASAGGSVGLAFYQGLIALLNDDVATVDRIRDQIRAIATMLPLAQTVALAFDQGHLANWDFPLSLGHSLHTKPAIAGLPVLTGLLAAGKVGMVGLPVALCQRLLTANPVAQAWLQQRWQLSSIAALDSWVQQWWQQWLGHDAPIPMPSIGVAVCPAALDSMIKLR
jgi:hypothetical protein